MHEGVTLLKKLKLVALEVQTVEMKAIFRAHKSTLLGEFTNHCSLHGIKYLGDKNLPWYERFFWMLILSVSFYGAAQFLKDTWDDWTNTPIVLVTGNTPLSIRELPNPALTLCTAHNIFKDSFTKLIRSSDEADRRRAMNIFYSFFGNTSKLLDDFWELNGYVFDDYKELISYNNSAYGMNKDEFVGTLRDVTFPNHIGKFPFNVMRSSFKINCSNSTYICRPYYANYFLTEFGVCFTINMLRPVDIISDKASFIHFEVKEDVETRSMETYGWDIDNGYSDTGNKDHFYPLAINTTFYSLVVERQSEEWITKIDSMYKYMIAIHNPADIPNAFMEWYEVRPGKQVTFIIQPKLTKTDAYLQTMDPVDWQCFYSYERNLIFFKNYTEMNCLLECITNITLYKCDCVPHYLPHLNNTQICSTLNECMYSEIGDSLYYIDHLKKCNCLPLCYEVRYPIVLKDSIDYDILDHLRIIYTYRTVTFLPLIREPKSTLAQFVIECITYLDMFLGFSLITIIEITYFFIIIMKWCFCFSYKEMKGNSKAGSSASSEIDLEVKKQPDKIPIETRRFTI